MSVVAVTRISKPIQSWAKDTLPPFTDEDALYPESDGEPMADSTLQWDWITRIKNSLEKVFENDPNVFIAGDHFWYPVHGSPDIRTAPDAMVIFGRPKGHRRSYRQWREDGIAPQVTFEIWSHSNRAGDKEKKLDFYQKYGVEEYYTYDPRPRKRIMEGWIRQNDILVKIAKMNEWVSPLLGVQFRRANDGEWNLYFSNGEPFMDFVDIYRQREDARQEARKSRIQEVLARQQAKVERAAKEAAWAKLRELGIDPEKL